MGISRRGFIGGSAALKELGGIGAFVHAGDYVVIKPNAAFANPSVWATTTHPDTVAAKKPRGRKR